MLDRGLESLHAHCLELHINFSCPDDILNYLIFMPEVFMAEIFMPETLGRFWPVFCFLLRIQK